MHAWPAGPEKPGTRQRDGLVGKNHAASSDGTVDGEVVFSRCNQAELGQSADFRRKRAPFDAEVVRELLAVERYVKFCRSFLLRH